MVFDAAVGGIANIAASGINNRNAIEREDIARKQNYIFGEMAAEEADRRTRALYDDLYSPKAKMEQLKEAGLSPALFYEGAGVGGASQAGAQGTGASGISPQIFGMNPLEGANVALAMAQARKANAEADTEEGKNERGIAEIARIWADKNAKKASQKLMEADTKKSELEAYVLDETKEFKIEYAEYLAKGEYYNSQRAGYLAEEEGLKLQFEKETYDMNIENAKTEVAQRIANLAKTKSEIRLNNEQVTYLQTKAKQILEEIKQEWNKVAIQKATWKSYDELVANKVYALQKGIDIDTERNDIAREKNLLDLISTIIGSSAHVAGMTMK